MNLKVSYQQQKYAMIKAFVLSFLSVSVMLVGVSYLMRTSILNSFAKYLIVPLCFLPALIVKLFPLCRFVVRRGANDFSTFLQIGWVKTQEHQFQLSADASLALAQGVQDKYFEVWLTTKTLALLLERYPTRDRAIAYASNFCNHLQVQNCLNRLALLS